ncbi:MAG: ADP-ribosylglycohydrolase family protein [Planctomycetales bacterium]|nr:ADP-ribosylglycohydrolase family protein [Planctomycetales bacterium]
MHSTSLRRDQIHGALIGAAVGDALGFPRKGMARRAALARYGRRPLRFSWLGGIYTPDTHLMLMSAQALLNSRSDLRNFRRAYRMRLSWYPLSLPIGCGWATLGSALKCWLVRLKINTGVNSEDNAPGASIVFCSLAMHGTGHRITKWADETVVITRSNVQARDAAMVLGALAEAASLNKPEKFDPNAVLGVLIETSQLDKTKKKLEELKPFLEQSRCPAAVARHFGWSDGISSSFSKTVVMAAYCFLRYPTNYRRAVEAAIRLGGDTSTMGAIVGGLVGAHAGVKAVPGELIKNLGGLPHNPDWIKDMAERMSHWPHGPDDLHMAPALPSDAPVQLIRNLYTALGLLLRRVLRLFCRCV